VRKKRLPTRLSPPTAQPDVPGSFADIAMMIAFEQLRIDWAIQQCPQKRRAI